MSMTPSCPDCGAQLELEPARDFIWTFTEPPDKLRRLLRDFGLHAMLWVCPWCFMPHWQPAL